MAEGRRLVAPAFQPVLYPRHAIYSRLALKLFRREPDISEFD